MEEANVKRLVREILALAEKGREAFACEVLPALLTTRAGLKASDDALRTHLDAMVERARRRRHDLEDATVGTIIGEALQAVRRRNGY